MSITLQNISKWYGSFTALKDVSLDIQSEELIALLGPSGSGKTTLLRVIAGLELADQGEVLLEGESMSSKHIRDRTIGFMFQHYTLFKHMTAFENIAFGLRVMPKAHRPKEPEIQRKVLKLLKLVHLEGLQDRYPSQLSGGQRQRVALARSLAVQPKILLLDEPFGALDAKVRKELRRFLRRLHDEIRVTTVFVTHDQEEAMEVADRVVIMNTGKIEQVGTPEKVWNSPKNSFVYDFLGNYNEFAGWKDKEGKIHLTEYDIVKKNPPEPIFQKEESLPSRYAWFFKVVHSLKALILPQQEKKVSPPKRVIKAIHGKGQKVKLFARPHEIVITREASGDQYIKAKIIHINPAGPLVKIELERRNGNLIQAELSLEVLDSLNLKAGEDVMIKPKHTKVFE